MVNGLKLGRGISSLLLLRDSRAVASGNFESVFFCDFCLPHLYLNLDRLLLRPRQQLQPLELPGPYRHQLQLAAPAASPPFQLPPPPRPQIYIILTKCAEGLLQGELSGTPGRTTYLVHIYKKIHSSGGSPLRVCAG